MSSKDSSNEEGVEVGWYEALDDSSKEQRGKPARVFRQSSSGDFLSSVSETDDSTKRKKKKEKNLYASPERRRGKDGDDIGDDEPSHLISLVRLKKSVNKYADGIVRKRNKRKTSKVSSRPIVDATPSDVEDPTIKASTSIALANDKGLPLNSSHHSGTLISLTQEQKEEAEKASKGILLVQEAFRDYAHLIEKLPIEIRVDDLTYSVPYTEASSKITTVYNSSFVYPAVKKVKQLLSGVDETKIAKVTQTKYILDGISLCLKPGKM